MVHSDAMPANVWILSSLAIFVAGFILTVCYIVHWFNRKPKHGTIPSMEKRDFTIDELREFDGEGPDARILVAVNGNVFDVTNDGKNFYGKGGPYSIFAGRDASRSLTMFTTNMSQCSDQYDDLSDLTSDQIKKLKEWELQFRERYDLVGRLLGPSEPHRVYDSEDEGSTVANDLSTAKSKSE